MCISCVNPKQEIKAHYAIKNCDRKLTLNCSVVSMWNIVKIFHVNWQRFSLPRTRTDVLERLTGVSALVEGTGWTLSCPPHPLLNDLFMYTCVHVYTCVIGCYCALQCMYITVQVHDLLICVRACACDESLFYVNVRYCA